MKQKNNCKRDEEHISQYILYVMVTLSALVFVTFYLVGFDVPFSGNASFNAPLLTDVLLGLMIFLFFATVGTVIYSVVHTLRKTGKEEGIVNGVPARKIAYTIFGAILLCLVLTFTFGSSKAMLINGTSYTDRFWLRLSDMFVTSSVILLALAAIAVAFGATRYYRKGRAGK